jgi:trk system potassium uptake protein TrkA
MYILIVGVGKVGFNLLWLLGREGHTLAAVEKEEKICQKVAEDLEDVLVIRGDGCDPSFLKEAGVEKAQVLVATTGDDEDNIIIAQLAKENFKVPRVVARINNPKNEPIFNKFGIDTVSGTAFISKLIEEEVTMGDILSLMPIKKGNFSVLKLDLDTTTPVVNNALSSVKLPEETVVISIIRGDDVILPKGETVFKDGDSVIALVKDENENQFRKIFLGKITSVKWASGKNETTKF